MVEESRLLLSGSKADRLSESRSGPMAAIRFKWTVRREDDGAY